MESKSVFSYFIIFLKQDIPQLPIFFNYLLSMFCSCINSRI